MQRSGHIGGAMLFSAMLSAQLGLLRAHALILALAASAVATFPDEDLKWHLHRGFTHSLLFLAFASAAFGLLGCFLWTILPSQLGCSEWSCLVSSVDQLHVFIACSLPTLVGGGSHLFFDLMTKSGIPVLWPSGRKYAMGLFRSSNTLANYGLLALGALFLTSILMGLP
ncbi:MAG: metal-dependent hydrolase [Candidatus Hadarchaeales archaeon]